MRSTGALRYIVIGGALLAATAFVQYTNAVSGLWLILGAEAINARPVQVIFDLIFWSMQTAALIGIAVFAGGAVSMAAARRSAQPGRGGLITWLVGTARTAWLVWGVALIAVGAALSVANLTLLRTSFLHDIGISEFNVGLLVPGLEALRLVGPWLGVLLLASWVLAHATRGEGAGVEADSSGGGEVEGLGTTEDRDSQHTVG